jgi:hypothetical protein
MYTQISAYPAGAKCFFLPAGEAPCSSASTTKKTLIFVTFPLWTINEKREEL